MDEITRLVGVHAPRQVGSPAVLNLHFVDRLLRTNHESWSYEQEVRMLGRLNDPPDEGATVLEFGPNLELKEAIIRSQRKPEDSDSRPRSARIVT